jgi:hypothetical protein
LKTIDELKNFYETELNKDLTVLETERKKVAGKVVLFNVFFGIGAGISVLLFFAVSFFAFFLIAADIAAWVILYGKATKNYKSDFKIRVIGKIIKFIDENLEYFPDDRISESEYLASDIFKQSPDRYSGDDLVTGRIGKTGLRFSEIHSEYETKRRDSNGNTTTEWHTIFKGLFFIGDFNKSFKGGTYVLPDVAQRMFGNVIGNMFQSWNKLRGQLIKMEDPDFEKLFVVYGDDQIESRYILSTSLMKRITDYKVRTKKDIYLSFRQNKIYFAISYNKDLFEPRIFKTLLDFSLIQEYFDDMQMATGIVEDLNLNTRIWA